LPPSTQTPKKTGDQREIERAGDGNRNRMTSLEGWEWTLRTRLAVSTKHW
jgi:hypothetical protein